MEHVNVGQFIAMVTRNSVLSEILSHRYITYLYIYIYIYQDNLDKDSVEPNGSI
jgi:hypothetical protein